MAESDKYYVEQCLDGHPDEFRYFVRRYQAALMAYLTGKLSNKYSAEEAAQETFVRAYFGLSELKKPESFYSWLLGIAERVVKEQLRSIKRFTKVDCLEQQQDPGKRIENDLRLEKAIAQLPDSYREIILLRFYADLSCLEIAGKLDMPIGTVTKTLSRAYVKLRISLGDEKEVLK
jgi:RNA polymerase sigma-70 factor (ECF subfamily)